MGWLQRLLGRNTQEPPSPATFPPGWRRILSETAPFCRWLTAGQRQRLERLIGQFVESKRFIGHGLDITDDMRVGIAAYACLLVLEIPELGLYPHTDEIIVYPGAFGESVVAIGPDEQRYHVAPSIAGQQIHRGPVLLAWDAVQHAFATPSDGHNVILHEFAHALDRLDRAYNGMPPLHNARQAAKWIRIVGAEYNALAAAAQRGAPTFIRPYGATNHTEFFAVVTEQFFEQPRELMARHPGLYAQFRMFYRQDPARWPRTPEA